MPNRLKRLLFLLFFLSGFSGLLYQIVWLRLAFASFGIVTQVLSLVISVFMLGLAIGSWVAGNRVARWKTRFDRSAIHLYASAELMIAAGAFAVPALFSLGERLLMPAGETDSASFMIFSAAIITVSMLPWCICMGATFPLMMEFVREQHRQHRRNGDYFRRSQSSPPTRKQATIAASEPNGLSSGTSFSFLYLANVIGAMCGTLVTAVVLVELVGFRATLFVGFCGNVTVAAVSLMLARRRNSLLDSANSSTIDEPTAAVPASLSAGAIRADGPIRLVPVILFATGFCSMALEVVWTRAFTPVLHTQVYSFASLLFTYLLATWLGSYVYRRHLGAGRVIATGPLLSILALTIFLQIIVVDPGVQFTPALTLASIVPFCGLLGYLTPKLIDEFSSGRPERAGRAYAVNVIGSILGPLLASYVLLPTTGVKWSNALLAAPLVLLAIVWQFRPGRGRVVPGAGIVLTLLAAYYACEYTTTYEERYAAGGAVVRRDHTATVISVGQEMDKRLLVNGIGITEQSTITKIMAHLPLVFVGDEPRSGLVICFGMGTTYRSLLSWDVRTTAVELVPSVRDAFGYYFDDAEAQAHNPLGRIVIDDGRRFLKRTDELFDVITIDPPPPVETAGSSLLYSEEFYELAKSRLTGNGVLHQWFPMGDQRTYQAILRSITNSFPYVKQFRGYDGRGMHFIASCSPLETPTAEEMVARMPEEARRDLMEWNPGESIRDLAESILRREAPVEEMLNVDRSVVITDDRPYNEYFALRRLWTGEFTVY